MIRTALVRSPNAKRNGDMLKYLNGCGWKGNDAVVTMSMGPNCYAWGVTVTLRDEQDCRQFERAMNIWGAQQTDRKAF